MEKSKVLVVIDSDWKFRNQIISLLKNRKIGVLGFDSGEFALEFLKDTQIHPDLIILDIELALGLLSGVEVAHKIRSEFGPQSPILFLSAEATVDIWPPYIANSRALTKNTSLRRIYKEVIGRGPDQALIQI